MSSAGERGKLNAELRARPRACQALTPICGGQATCWHELRKRSAGGSITDRANLLAVCFPCNGWIEDHPDEAVRRGLVVRAKGLPEEDEE